MTIDWTTIPKRILDNEDFVRCRSLGHIWDDFTPIDERRPPRGVLLSFRCERCHAERHDVIDRSDGSLLHRKYKNRPAGYDIHRADGETRPTAAVLRVRILKLQLNGRKT